MASVRTIAEGVGEHVPEILEDWRKLVAEREWLDLPADVDMDHLPELVAALVDATFCGDDDPDARTGVLRFALKHGRHRREDGLEDHVLFQEFHVLREAIWQGLQDRHGQDPNRFPAIGRIDMVITSATRGSLHGYHEAPHPEEEKRLARELAEKCYWPSSPSDELPERLDD